MNKRLLFVFALLGLSLNIYAQCVQCTGPYTLLGTNASIMGTGCDANGHSALSSGYNSTASGNYSTALGHYAHASGIYSVAIGKNVTAQDSAFVFGLDISATAINSLTIGSGFSSTSKLTNNIPNSIMFGMGSSTPSMTIRQNSVQNVPAYVGIGTTDPKKELHVDGNVMISNSNNALLFANSASSTDGDFGIKLSRNGLEFFKPNNGSPMNNLLYIGTNGNIGIGSSNTTYKLNIAGSARSTSFQTETLTVTDDVIFNNLAGNTTQVVTVDNNGELSTTSFSTLQDNLGNHIASQNLNLNGYRIINTGNNGGIFINTNNNVGIGTLNPIHELSVNGTIQAKELIVTTLAADWPDFVFDPEYKLTSLHELDKYIESEKHLPGVPSANEISERGIKVGEMNAILLQKVEELTLYVIELQKQIDELKGDKK